MLRYWFGEQHSSSANAIIAIFGLQDYPGCYRWLFPAVISSLPASKSRSFRRQGSSGRCSIAAFISDISYRQESPRQLHARRP
jgi:hypothetical protein